MAKDPAEIHQDCMQRFVELANTMKQEGIEGNVIAAGLMTASGVFSSYVAAGNKGGLTDSGIDKVTNAYREQLERIQQAKKDRNEKRDNA